MKISYCIFGLVLGFCVTVVAGHPYKYSLDPKYAEEVLSQLSFRPRLSDKNWRELLGSLEREMHTVKRGETLWRISQRAVSDPFLWRKIWQLNPEVDNPHLITPGQVLAYYRESRGLASYAGTEIPIVKLIPDDKNAVSSLDNDSFVNISLKNRFRPSIYVVPLEEPIFGQISGARLRRTYFIEGDTVYVRQNGSQLISVGDKFGLIEMDRRLIDRRGEGRVLGTLGKYVGELKIERIVGELAEAKITGSYQRIYRGSQLVRTKEAIEWVNVAVPPQDLELAILGGEADDFIIFGQGQIVLLDKGLDAGVRIGQVFRVLQDTDPAERMNGEVIPDFKGEIQIVHSSQLASVGYILNNSDPIQKGDILLASQVFPDRSNPVRRFLEPFEIQ